MRKREQMRPRRSLAWALAVHFVMGASLGAFLGCALLFRDADGMARMIMSSADPVSTILVFIGTLTLNFAMGAAITGLMFTLQDRK